MIKKFNEHKSTERRNCYVTLRNGQLVNRDLYVQYFGDGKPFMAHDGRGIGAIFYEFALTYDDMIKKFVKNQNKRKRLETIKDDYLRFLETKELGTKVYTKDPNKTGEWMECVWDGQVFGCGSHMFFFFDDILNMPIWFQKPEGVNIVTNWTRKGYQWDDRLKSWTKIRKS